MQKKSKVILYFNYFFLVIFLLALIVQWNDPDPFAWMMMYGAAVLVCILYAWFDMKWFFPALVGVIALIWALTLAPDVFGSPSSFDETVGSWEMQGLGVEESREMFGLAIIFTWMLILTFVTRKKKTLTSNPAAEKE